MGIRNSPYQSWYREISADWIKTNWDGRVWIDVGDGWTAIELPGGPRVYATASFGANSINYAVVEAHAPDNDKAARLSLRRISVGHATPDGMTALQRWRLVDENDFKPEQFLEDLTASITRPLNPEIMP